MRRFATAVLLVTLLGGLTAACSDKKDDASTASKGATGAKATTTVKDTAGATDTTTTSATTGKAPTPKPGDSEFVTKVIAAFAGAGDEAMLNEKDARCVAESLDDNMSDAAKATVDSSDSDFSDLSQEDQAAFKQAFDDCVSVDVMIASMARAFGASAEVSTCLSKGIKAAFPSSGQVISAFVSEDAKLNSIYESCVPAGSPGGA